MSVAAAEMSARCGDSAGLPWPLPPVGDGTKRGLVSAIVACLTLTAAADGGCSGPHHDALTQTMAPLTQTLPMARPAGCFISKQNIRLDSV